MKKALIALWLVCALSVSALAGDAKLINEKKVFAASQPVYKTPMQYHIFSMRISPDTKHLLFSRLIGEPVLRDGKNWDDSKLKFELVLRDMQAGKDVVLPTAPVDRAWHTAAMRLNFFSPFGEQLLLIEPADGRNIRYKRYDVATGSAVDTDFSGPLMMLKFAQNGRDMVGSQSMKEQELFVATAPDYKRKKLTIKGMSISVCPTDNIACVWLPPVREAYVPPPPGSMPATRGNLVEQQLILVDFLSDTELVSLPVHPQNGQLDDFEAQWTPDGRYVSYIDREDHETVQDGRRSSSRPIARIWDRKEGKGMPSVTEAFPVGPGPAPSSMIMLKRKTTGDEGFFLYDVATGQQHPLGENTWKLIHAWGGKVVYAKPGDDGTETVYIADIEFKP